MKKAVILVGKHFSGKSFTINRHLKRQLKVIGTRVHKFILNGKRGFILSQSFEEAQRDVATTIKKYSNYELLVLAARPSTESGSKLNEMSRELKKNSFSVVVVTIISKTQAAAKAREIFNKLM